MMSSPSPESYGRRDADSGSVLTADEIEDYLARGEIFREGSWAPENIRAAAYDLRMAGSLIIIPDQEEPSGFRRFARDAERTAKVALEPGDVAFVTTVERLAMPWTIAANLGLKFTLASRGILVFTGLFVDPGYGLRWDDSDGWVPKEDARLHFLLVNVGPDGVSLDPGTERIAAIQFNRVAEPSSKKRFERTDDLEIDRQYFDATKDPGAGLVFFRNLADLKSEMQLTRQALDMSCAAVDKRVAKTEQVTGEFRERLAGIESGSNNILMFGVYLFSVTILGVAITTILTTVARIDRPITWPNAAVFVIAFLSIGWIAVNFLKLLPSLVNRIIPRQDDSDTPPSEVEERN